jgi:hypothetical protein
VNNICICGHVLLSHYFDYNEDVIIWPEKGDSWCADCKDSRKSFHNFKLDNLKYLEEQYESRSDAESAVKRR